MDKENRTNSKKLKTQLPLDKTQHRSICGLTVQTQCTNIAFPGIPPLLLLPPLHALGCLGTRSFNPTIGVSPIDYLPAGLARDQTLHHLPHLIHPFIQLRGERLRTI